MQQYDFGSIEDCDDRLSALFPGNDLQSLLYKLSRRIAGVHTPAEFIEAWQVEADECPPPYELSDMQRAYLKAYCMSNEFRSTVGIQQGNYILTDPYILAWHLLKQPVVIGVALPVAFCAFVAFTTAYLIQVGSPLLDYMPLVIGLGAGLMVADPVVRFVIELQHQVVAIAALSFRLFDVIVEAMDGIFDKSNVKARHRQWERRQVLHLLKTKLPDLHLKVRQLEQRALNTALILFGVVGVGLLGLLSVGVNPVFVAALPLVVYIGWLLLYGKDYLKQRGILLDQAKQQLERLSTEATQ